MEKRKIQLLCSEIGDIVYGFNYKPKGNHRISFRMNGNLNFAKIAGKVYLDAIDAKNKYDQSDECKKYVEALQKVRFDCIRKDSKGEPMRDNQNQILVDPDLVAIKNVEIDKKFNKIVNQKKELIKTVEKYGKEFVIVDVLPLQSDWIKTLPEDILGECAWQLPGVVSLEDLPDDKKECVSIRTMQAIEGFNLLVESSKGAKKPLDETFFRNKKDCTEIVEETVITPEEPE